MFERTRKDILRDIVIYYRNGIGDIQALLHELGNEIDESEAIREYYSS